MASWTEVEAAAPALAATTRRLFDAHKHKTIATIRQDGSPRISGTEVVFRDGEMWIGSMFGARKARDLQRDPRFALHSASEDPPAPGEAEQWSGDAKVAGRMTEVVSPEVIRAVNGEAAGQSHLFRADITEVAVVRLNEAGEQAG